MTSLGTDRKLAGKMIQRQLKLRLTVSQERDLECWLWHLTGAYNWAIRKIELDAQDNVYHSDFGIKSLVSFHGQKIGVPGDVLSETVKTAWMAWDRCFNHFSGRPKFKGKRNRLNSIPFRKDILLLDKSHARLAVIGSLKFHKQDIPKGVIKCGRIIKRSSGWYLCLCIEAEPNKIPKTGNGKIGIDPGFSSLLTLSNGEKIEHPRELEATANRLAQAQRGKRKQLTARLHERIANQRKDRNHKLSRRLVSQNKLIVFSADNHKIIARRFGNSVASSGHYQLRSMLSYKSLCGGRKYIEVNSKNSTKTCSACGALSGPAGLTGLSVRLWVCSCGAEHDRDINAAMNTLKAGAGIALKSAVKHVRNLTNRRIPSSPESEFSKSIMNKVIL